MSIKWKVVKFFVIRELKFILARILSVFKRKPDPPKPPEEFEINPNIKEIGP